MMLRSYSFKSFRVFSTFITPTKDCVFPWHIHNIFVLCGRMRSLIFLHALDQSLLFTLNGIALGLHFHPSIALAIYLFARPPPPVVLRSCSQPPMLKPFGPTSGWLFVQTTLISYSFDLFYFSWWSRSTMVREQIWCLLV